MNIYLIRHGDAEKASTLKKDFDRTLTPEGEKKIKIAAEGWKFLTPQFSHIISSPLVRALQTAQIVAQVYKFAGKIYMTGALARLNLAGDKLHKNTRKDAAANLSLFPSKNILENV